MCWRHNKNNKLRSGTMQRYYVMQKKDIFQRSALGIYNGDVINHSYFVAKSIKDIFSGIDIAGTSNTLANKKIPGKQMINSENR